MKLFISFLFIYLKQATLTHKLMGVPLLANLITNIVIILCGFAQSVEHTALDIRYFVNSISVLVIQSTWRPSINVLFLVILRSSSFQIQTRHKLLGHAFILSSFTTAIFCVCVLCKQNYYYPPT